jgi:SAM-dependent methyltransferase
MNDRKRKWQVEWQEDWRRWVTPTPLKEEPVHRWYYFPHSFTNDLVDALIDEWGLDESDHILDLFCGAGTTLVAAKKRGISATGYDLSPLAVLVSRVKTSNYQAARLRSKWQELYDAIDPASWNGASKAYPVLVREALPGKLLGAFDAIARSIEALGCSDAERRFFQLALLQTLPQFSRAVATGGWLSWTSNRRRTSGILSTLHQQTEQMLRDVEQHTLPRRNGYHAAIGDARNLPDENAAYSAVITSPPYPNRHDYTRVFGVELMFGFLNWAQTRQLRYQSFASHPEAKPRRPATNGYAEPVRLSRILSRLEKHELDARIMRMLKGYFLDSYLCLREAARVSRKKAHLAFVLGNAQYCGVSIPVDELVAEIGEHVGLHCQKLIAVRSRGNSAQQMGAYGRNPSRESVVVFRKA